MSLRVAFAGTGWASRIHAKAALMSVDAALTGAVNHRAQSLRDFADEFGMEGRFATVEELIAAGCADALVISTPNALHVGQAIAALNAGLHVLVEKPMAIDASEAAAMLRAATRSGAYLMLAHCFRFDPRIIWLREQIAAGMLGRIIRSKGYGVHVAAGPKGWFVDPTLAGGGRWPTWASTRLTPCATCTATRDQKKYGRGSEPITQIKPSTIPARSW